MYGATLRCKEAATTAGEAQQLPEGFGSEPGESQCRDEFEQWYTTHAFDLKASPIGSRDCVLQWSAWMHASVKYAAPTAPTVDQAITSLVTALSESKGWLRAYADSIIRDAIDRRGEDAAALPFAILDDELAALHRFYETTEDGQDYDVPVPMMKQLATIGLVRRVTGNRYEFTDFGLSVRNGDFALSNRAGKGLG